MTIHPGSTLGAVYIGNTVAAILYGMTIIQTFNFFRTSSRDRMSLRIMIFFLWILETLHSALVTDAIYYYTVTNFDNPSALLDVTWSMMGQLFVAITSDLLVRYIFGQRLWRFSGKNWPLAISVAGFSLFAFGSGATFGIRAFQVTAFRDTKDISWLYYSALAGGVIVDCLIAISLCVCLLRSRTGYKRTDSLLNVLMLYSIYTGMITGVCAIIALVTYAIMPNKYYYVAVSFILNKVNVNCLLASLNARSPLRDQMYRSSAFVRNTGIGEVDSRSIPSSLTAPIAVVTEKFPKDMQCPHADCPVHIARLDAGLLSAKPLSAEKIREDPM